MHPTDTAVRDPLGAHDPDVQRLEQLREATGGHS